MAEEHKKDESRENKEERNPRDDKGIPKGKGTDRDTTILGISEAELEIYSLIIAYGNATVGDLSLLDKKRSIGEIEDLLASLKRKKMVVELPGIVPRFQAVPPFDGLAKEVSEVSQRIENLRQELKEQIRSASVSIRDALTAMAHDNLTAISARKKETENRKKSARESIDSKKPVLRAIVDDTLQKHETSTEAIISNWKTSSAEILATSAATSGEIISSTVQNLKDIMSTTNLETAELADSLHTDIVGILSELDRSSKERINANINEIEGLLSKTTDSFKEKMNASEQSISATVRSNEQSLTNALDVASSTMTQAYQRGEHETRNSINTATSDISSKYMDMESAIGSALDEKAGREETLLDGFAASLDTSFSKHKDITIASLKQLQASQIENYKTLETSVNSGIDSMTSQVDEMESRSSSFLETTANTMKASSYEAMREFHDRVAQYSTDVTQDTHSLLNIRKEQLKKSMDELLLSIQQSISAQVTETTKTLDELAVKIDNSHQGMVTTLNSSLENAKQNLDSKILDLNQATASAISQISASSKESLTQMQAEVESAIEISRTANLTTSSEIDKSVLQANNELRDAKEELLGAYRNDISEVTQNLRSRVASLTASGQDTTKQSATAIIAALEQAIRSSREVFDTEIRNLKESASGLTLQDIENIRSTFESTATDFGSTIESIRNGTSRSLSSVASTISENRSGAQDQIDTTTKALKAGVQAKLNSKSGEIDSLEKNAIESLDIKSQDLRNSMETAGKDLREKTKNLMTTNLEAAHAEFEGLLSQVQQDMTQGYQELTDQLSSLEKDLSTSINKLDQSPMVGLTNESLEEAFESSSQDQVNTQEVAERLSSVWSRIGAMDFPGAKKTWTVVTRSAVNAHIIDMLQRAKSKITLIVPEVGDIPTETLIALKTTTGVELVITEGGALGPAVKPLIGRGNIRVRSRSEKDVFACVRDSEEVLMAPAASQDADVIGVVSEDGGFVRFVMSIIGPIFQAKTKLLKPEDL